MLFGELCKKGADFLGVKYPILAGAMTWVSDSDLTAAVSNAGGFGVLAGGNIPPDIFKEEIENCFKKTKNNFGVNIITVSPVFKEQLEVVLKIKEVKFLIFAGGLPNSDNIARAKEAGKKVIAFAPTLKFAQRLEKLGVDALVIEGNEAGGHIGSVTTMVLVQEILFNIKETPVFVAGGIGTGKMIAHLLLMGASGIQLGTRFVLSTEANVHEKMKGAFLKADARDAAVSFGIDRKIPVIPVRSLKNKGHENFIRLQFETLNEMESGQITAEEGSVKVEEFWLGALRRAAKEGDLENGSLMAGSSVGLFKEIKPVKDIINEYITDANKTLQEIQAMVCK